MLERQAGTRGPPLAARAAGPHAAVAGGACPGAGRQSLRPAAGSGRLGMDRMQIQVSRSGEAAGGLASVLPRGFATAVCIGSPSPEPLFPTEAALVSAAVDRRRIEFARGRSCARHAMALLGAPAAPILATPQRAPIWPAGLVGSISHASEYCCAAIGWADDWAAVGVDVEVLQPIDSDVERNILSPAERSALERLDRRIPWACVVFSIKEAMYKLWNPLMTCWLDFHDALVRLDPAARRFELSVIGQPAPSIPPALRRIEGRFDIVGLHVVSAVALPRGQIPELVARKLGVSRPDSTR